MSFRLLCINVTTFQMLINFSFCIDPYCVWLFSHLDTKVHDYSYYSGLGRSSSWNWWLMFHLCYSVSVLCRVVHGYRMYVSSSKKIIQFVSLFEFSFLDTEWRKKKKKKSFVAKIHEPTIIFLDADCTFHFMHMHMFMRTKIWQSYIYRWLNNTMANI